MGRMAVTLVTRPRHDMLLLQRDLDLDQRHYQSP
jgi:hypothetical protein